MGDAEIRGSHVGPEEDVHLVGMGDIGDHQQAADPRRDERFFHASRAAPASTVSSFSINPAGMVQ